MYPYSSNATPRQKGHKPAARRSPVAKGIHGLRGALPQTQPMTYALRRKLDRLEILAAEVAGLDVRAEPVERDEEHCTTPEETTDD